MKQTNDKAILRLTHMPTGEPFDWQFADHAVPAVHYIQKRVEEKREQLNDYLDKHDIDLQDENDDTPSEKVLEVSKLNGEIINLKIDALSCILEPKDELPEGRDKRHYIEECIGSYGVIDKIMDFFSEHFGSSIWSRDRSRRHFQILDAEGNPWHSNNTKDSDEETSSTG